MNQGTFPRIFKLLMMGVIVFACCAAAPQVFAQDHLVPQRILPVPSTVSKAMQALIGTPRPDNPNGPHSTQEWIKFLSNPDWQKDLEKAAGVSVSDVAHRIAALCKRYDVVMTPEIIAGVGCFEITPNTIPKFNGNRLLVGIHGGGYVSGAGLEGVDETIRVSGVSHIKAIAVDYRMPPRFPYPAAMNDVFGVWKEVCRTKNSSAVAIFGSSTGGAMTLALVQRAKLEGAGEPGAIFAGTPWSDLSKTGDSYFVNAEVDGTLKRYEGLLEAAAILYANGKKLSDPRLSPIYGDFSHFPPTLLLCGTRDLFLSNTARVQEKLIGNHTNVQLLLLEGQSHGEFMLDDDAPETGFVLNQISEFFDRYLSH